MSKAASKPKPVSLQYVPLYAAAWHHPKVYGLMRALGITHAHAFGLFSGLVAQASEFRGGHIPGQAHQLAGMLEWLERPARELGAALVECRLVDVDADGEWWQHDWAEYCGKSQQKVAQLIDNLRGSAGARPKSEANTERECVPVAAATASNLSLSSLSRCAPSDPEQAADAPATALQEMDLSTPFDDPPDLVEQAEAFLASPAADGDLTVEQWMVAEFPAFDGRSGRRPRREVVLLFLENEQKLTPRQRSTCPATLIASLRRWCQRDYKDALPLWQAERAGDDQERRRTGEAQPAPTGNRGIEQTLARMREVERARADHDAAAAAEGLAAMRLAQGLGAAA